MSGVYIIKNVNKSDKNKLYIKIGCSKNIEKRIEQIKKSFRFNGNLDDLIIYQTIECKSYMKLEKTLHTCLKSRQITNEWYFTEEAFLLNRLSMVDLSRYN
jgi:hypothetical protein